MALTNLGLALQEVRRLEEAITAHQDAATLFRETGDRHREIIALENLGESTISGFKVRRPASTGVRQHPPSQVTGTRGRPWTLAHKHGLQHKLQLSGSRAGWGMVLPLFGQARLVQAEVCDGRRGYER